MEETKVYNVARGFCVPSRRGGAVEKKITEKKDGVVVRWWD
jgi:hypothetical protein